MKAFAVFAAGLALLPLALSVADGRSDRALHPLHAVHAEELDCSDCHDQAATSMTGLDDLLPEKAVCADCHDVEDEGECGICHTDVANPAGYGRTPVAERFPHATHLTGGMECADCHGPGTEEPLLAGKTSCRTCHATAPAQNDCGLCHGATEELRPASHTPQYLTFHGLDAGWDQASCENCHTQSDCQDCHSGDNVRPRAHSLNFVFDHALQARSNEISCASCHQDASFCSSCHVAEGVLPSNHSRADWVLLSGGRHGEEALFDMEGCIACHDAGAASPSCARCHGE